VIAIFLAVPAERRALEDVASPYTAVRGRGPSSIAAPAPASYWEEAGQGGPFAGWEVSQSSSMLQTKYPNLRLPGGLGLARMCGKLRQSLKHVEATETR